MERLVVGVQDGLEHVRNLLFGGVLHFHAQPDADDRQDQRRDQRPDPQLRAKETSGQQQDTGNTGRARVSGVGLVHLVGLAVVQVLATALLKIQPRAGYDFEIWFLSSVRPPERPPPTFTIPDANGNGVNT